MCIRDRIYPSSVLFYDPSAGCNVCFEKRGSGPTARTPSIFSPYGDPNLIYTLSRAEQPGQQPVLRSAHGTENRIHSLSLTYGRTLRKTDLRRARRRYRTSGLLWPRGPSRQPSSPAGLRPPDPVLRRDRTRRS